MPQPIDFNTESARQIAADRIQDIASRLSLAAQQRHVIEDNEQRVLRETQVQDTKQSENSEVSGDGRRQNPFVGVRKKRKAKSGDDTPSSIVYTQDEKTEVAGNLEGVNLDIEI